MAWFVVSGGCFQVAKVLKDKVMVDMDYEGEEIKEIVKILKINC